MAGSKDDNGQNNQEAAGAQAMVAVASSVHTRASVAMVRIPGHNWPQAMLSASQVRQASYDQALSATMANSAAATRM
jgi:hypothetical protein